MGNARNPWAPTIVAVWRLRKGVMALRGANGEPWPRVCEHCGVPERPNTPVQTYSINDREYLLHPRCQEDWLESPDPDGWTFNLE